MYEIDKKRRMDGTKLLWHMDRVNDRYIHNKRVAPIHIDMGIAKFCNISCVFCYGKYQKIKPVFIKRQPLLQAMKDAAEIGVKSIGLIGDGDPTCNPRFYEALKVGKLAGLDMSTSTNGVLVNTEQKMLAILQNCKWMRFCISAGTRQGYIKIHQKDKFDIAVQNIRKMVQLRDKKGLKCQIGMQAVFVPTLMVEQMIQESKLAIKLGVDYLVIKQCSLPDDGQSGMSTFDINQYDNPKIDQALNYCKSLSTEKTQIIPKMITIKKKGRKNYQYCHSISLISQISGNGDWYPCGYMFGQKPEFQKYKFGNLHDMSLKQIWQSDRYWQIVNNMQRQFDVHKNCKGCCRQDACNQFIYDYLQIPKGVNFI